MNLYRPRPAFTENDLLIVNTFAAYASTAIKNARIYNNLINEMSVREQAEAKVRLSEEKYRSLVNSSPDIIMRVDREGIINYINNPFAGEKSSDLIGKSIYEHMPSEFHDKAKRAIKMVFRTGDRFNYEHIGVTSEDDIKWYRNNVGPIESKGQIIGATIIARDITEEKQIDVMKTEFISSVSHELRTPLAIIQESISQVIDGLHGDLSDMQKDVLNPCLSDIERLTRIINNLLDISKIEGQKVSITRDMVDVVSLAENVLHSLLFWFRNSEFGKQGI